MKCNLLKNNKILKIKIIYNKAWLSKKKSFI